MKIFSLQIGKKIKARIQGFSLVELLVVVAIFLVITAITLGKQSKFSSDILITNLAYQIALSIREAQVYGIGSKQAADNVGGRNFKFGYGIHIGAPADLTAKATDYNFFADRNDSGQQFVYEAGSDQDIDLVSLTQGQRVHNFCAHSPRSGGWDCWETENIASHFDLNIVFIKPDPESHIWAGYANTFQEYDEAIIVVQSALGDKCRTVRVTEAGQIAVDPTDPADAANGCDVAS